MCNMFIIFVNVKIKIHAPDEYFATKPPPSYDYKNVY